MEKILTLDTTVIFFVVITLINVILSTVKSILTVKSSRGVATLINAIAYGFYTLVVKSMSAVSTETVVISTIGCNLVGVYFSMWLLDKFKKDVLWKITVVPEMKHMEKIREELQSSEIGYNIYSLNTKYGNQSGIDIFSKSQSDSKIIKEILNSNGKVKYHIMEIGKQL